MMVALLASAVLHARLLLSPVEWSPGPLALPTLEVHLVSPIEVDGSDTDPTDAAVARDAPEAPARRQEAEPLHDAPPIERSEPAAAFDPSDALENLGESLTPAPLSTEPGAMSGESAAGNDSIAAGQTDDLPAELGSMKTESAGETVTPVSVHTTSLAPAEQAWLTSRLVSEAPELLQGGAMTRRVELTKGGRKFAAVLTRQLAGDETGVERVKVEIDTEQDGVHLQTSMEMKRLAFSHFTQLIDFWNPSVMLHDDEIDGRFHSNSEILLTYDRNVAPRLLGMVTTSHGVRITEEKGSRSRREIFAGGLETRSARIRLPKLNLFFAQRDTGTSDVQIVHGDALIVFRADGGYDCTDLASHTEVRHPLAADRPTYVVGERDAELRVRGFVNGNVTVYSPERIVIQGDLTYAQRAQGEANPAFLGLISDGDVVVDRADVTGPGDLEIDAAVYARRRFVVRDAAARGRATLIIYGSLTACSVSESEPR